MTDCIFCKIVAGDMPCFKIFEDDNTLAFLDLFPAARGHTLIIPKNHCTDIFDANAEDIAACAHNSVALAAAVEKVIGCDGLGIFQLNRAAAGQTVFHYHTHLIPAWEGQQMTMHGRAQGDSDELTALASEIAKAL